MRGQRILIGISKLIGPNRRPNSGPNVGRASDEQHYDDIISNDHNNTLERLFVRLLNENFV